MHNGFPSTTIPGSAIVVELIDGSEKDISPPTTVPGKLADNSEKNFASVPKK